MAHARIPTWRIEIDATVRDAVLADIDQVLATGRFRIGPFTRRIEDRLATDWGRHVVALGSGMNAIEMLLESFDVRGRRVLVPGSGFQFVPALVARLGGRPTPVDVEPTYVSMDERVLDLACLAERPIVYWPHHVGMVHPRAGEIIAALRARGCPVIEDCAGCLHDPPHGAGTWGDAAILSFGPTKPVSGSAGGAVLTGDASLAAEIHDRRYNRDLEPRWRAGDQFTGNRDLPEIDATVMYHQWMHAGDTRDQMAQVAAWYAEELAHTCASVLVPDRDYQTTWSRFMVGLAEPVTAESAQATLCDHHRIDSNIIYEWPWFDYPALAEVVEFDDPAADWKDLRTLVTHSLCIPFFPTLTRPEVTRVATALAEVISLRD